MSENNGSTAVQEVEKVDKRTKAYKDSLGTKDSSLSSPDTRNVNYLQDMVVEHQTKIDKLEKEAAHLRTTLSNLINVLRPLHRGIFDRFSV